jgi:hypothetical protein
MTDGAIKNDFVFKLLTIKKFDIVVGTLGSLACRRDCLAFNSYYYFQCFWRDRSEVIIESNLIKV